MINQNKIAFIFASENDLWIDDLFSLGVPFSSGNENTNLLNAEDGMLYKSNNLMNTRTITGLFEKVILHNKFFPETNYEFVGFTGIDNGLNREPYIEVIFKQQLIDNSELANKTEIEMYFKKIGFKKIKDTSFSINGYTISDLHPRNVLKDKNGEIYIIDAEIAHHDNQPAHSIEECLTSISSIQNTSPIFINQIHRESAERKIIQISKWKKIPIDVQAALRRQRKREKQYQ